MIHRIDVRMLPLAREGAAGLDPVGQSLRHQIQEFAPDPPAITTSRIFLIDTDANRDELEGAARMLLADAIVESAQLSEASLKDDSDHSRIEIHLKPGVMDPVASSTEM